jgi:hypothetical protein
MTNVQPDWSDALSWAKWWAMNGDNFRLALHPTEETMINVQPDWSAAPSWANWWAVNHDRFPDGDAIWAVWFENEPKYNSGIWVSPRGRGQEDNKWKNVDCIDYRQTLRRRP